MGIDVFELNCSTGPFEMAQSIQWLNEQNKFPLLVMLNAGMPSNEGGKAIYAMTPNGMCGKLQAFVEN